MRNRIHLAWAALRGRPIIAGVEIEHATINAPGTVTVGANTALRFNKISAGTR